jgi:4'-phosphopantetheinyl transferase
MKAKLAYSNMAKLSSRTATTREDPPNMRTAREHPDSLKRGGGAAWSSAPVNLTFPSGRLDVWRVRTDGPKGTHSDLDILHKDEIVRAERFRFEKDRYRFTRCRSALRRLLAAYLEISPAEILFEYGARGKPRLALRQNPHALQFNVSHSGELALIAIGSEQSIGVDIERIRTEIDTKSLAERFFSVHERSGLEVLPVHLRTTGFYACWTRKEAFLKATGDGLSFPLANFSVTTHPDLDPEIVEINGSTEAGQEWSLIDISVGEGYRTTLCKQRSCCQLETYAWN